MSGPWISTALRAAVQQRARHCCEYCLVPAGAVMWPHEPDHIIATQHRGKTQLENLALACFRCNRLKGPNVASVDPETGRITPLFNPRLQQWNEHFRPDGAFIVALSENGRATVQLLRFNAPERLLIRQVLQQSGRY